MHCRTQRTEVLNSILVTPSVTPVVDLVDFKKHIRVEELDTIEDSLMETYLQAATEQAADYTGRVFGGSYEAVMDSFQDSNFDIVPADATSIVVTYYDSLNASQTLSDSSYDVINNGPNEPITIEFKGTLPEVYDRIDAVKIAYEAGYSVIPARIKTAIMIQAAGYFENRQSEQGVATHDIVYGFHQLLFPYKIL